MDPITTERMAAKIKELETLGASELLAHVGAALGRERRLGAYVVACLAVMDQRRIHIAAGYASLYDFLTRGMGLDEAGAWQRAQIARASHKVPEVLTKLAESRISVAVAGKVSGQLTRQNGSELLALCEGKSCREADALIAAHHKGRAAASPSLRRSGQGDPPAPHAAGSLEAAAADRFNIRLSIGQLFHDNMRRLGLLLGMYDIKYRMEDVLGRALEDALDKRDPMRKQARVDERQKRALDERGKADHPIAASSSNGTISAPLRREVLLKAGYQCQYVGPDGVRCSSRTLLQIDHRIPRAKGGSCLVENLQVLCQTHNQHAADVVFGRDFMEKKRQETK